MYPRSPTGPRRRARARSPGFAADLAQRCTGETGPVIEPRDGAWVAEATGLVDQSAWPPGTRLILRKERPHPGAQLRITDHDGMRVTGTLTNTAGGQLADLEMRHRRHARVEDRIRAGKDTGMRNLPYHDLTQNRIWLQICALAADLLAWCQRLALTGPAAAYEPKRLRLRILAVAGRLIRTGHTAGPGTSPARPPAEHQQDQTTLRKDHRTTVTKHRG